MGTKKKKKKKLEKMNETNSWFFEKIKQKLINLEPDSQPKAGRGGSGCRSIKSGMKKKLPLTEKYRVL